jgi:hypothetical protein
MPIGFVAVAEEITVGGRWTARLERVVNGRTKVLREIEGDFRNDAGAYVTATFAMREHLDRILPDSPPDP